MNVVNQLTAKNNSVAQKGGSTLPKKKSKNRVNSEAVSNKKKDVKKYSAKTRVETVQKSLPKRVY